MSLEKRIENEMLRVRASGKKSVTNLEIAKAVCSPEEIDEIAMPNFSALFKKVAGVYGFRCENMFVRIADDIYRENGTITAWFV